MKKKPETAAAAVARLNSDPEYLARRAVHDAEMAVLIERRHKEVAPLLDDLRTLGLDLTRPWELKERADDLKIAFPVLLQHLGRSYSDNTLGNIARLFQTRDARAHWDSILSLYESLANSAKAFSQDQLASAIAVMATKSDFQTLVRLLRDPRLGSSRLAFVPAVIKLGKDEGWAELRLLENDPPLSKEIARRFSGKVQRERTKDNPTRR